jgi:hypothetical protein
MDVTAIEVWVVPSGKLRGRVCQRADGLFQYVMETLTEETAELRSYWVNQHPPSGIFKDQADALAALRNELPSSMPLDGAKVTTFDIRVGPYPDPI